MSRAWRQVADDNSPTDIDSFIKLKQQESAVQLGVFLDGELGGYLSCSPIDFDVCDGHMVVARRFFHPDTTVEVIEMAKQLAWSWGYEAICCRVFPDNSAMIRLLQKVGARLTDERFETKREGEPVEMLVYVLSKD